MGDHDGAAAADATRHALDAGAAQAGAGWRALAPEASVDRLFYATETTGVPGRSLRRGWPARRAAPGSRELNRATSSGPPPGLLRAVMQGAEGRT